MNQPWSSCTNCTNCESLFPRIVRHCPPETRRKPMQSVRISRRQFLYATGASALSLAVAACVQAPGAQPAEGAGAGQAPVTLKLWKAPHKPAGEEVKIAEDVLN